ncbi:MAG: type ISP restriction/modification enzyme, partial [Rhodococcus sp. (in: high G+C Gram-positive bacteria)]|uniref:type ISP restriction/modification enzyme n=1 Tax=Rhodococcus sp. TaxID=1831 RepID=UPI003BB12AB1
ATYTPFEGIVLADTFQITEDGDSLDAVMFPQNNDRIVRQLATPINVVVGNPPYSVGQTSANDLNANIAYPTLDRRIEKTFARRSTAGLKRNLYDSYVRAFRWATDRIGNAGVVAFVSNGGWIEANSCDGIRLSLADEYSRIYVYNLRGNTRTSGEQARKEGGQTFGSGSRATIAILIGVKNPAHTDACEIFYRDIGDYLTREDKLRIIDDGALDTIDWQTITPNTHGDWTSQRNDDFETWPAIGDKNASKDQVTVFSTFSAGLQTNRDTWVSNSSRAKLTANVRQLIDNYNTQHAPFAAYCRAAGATRPNEATVTGYLTTNPHAAQADFIKWSRSLRTHLARKTQIAHRSDGHVVGLYRPFSKQHTYFDGHLNHERSQLPSIFPTAHHSNLGIVLTAPASHFEFTPFITDLLPNLHLLDTGQFFPRWTYVKAESVDGELNFASTDDAEVDEYGYRRVDNITDGVLALYSGAIGDQVTKDDIFYYIYGLLHDPAYRETYAADLKKMLPHISTPETRERFEQLATAGRSLADLHVNYETVAPYEVDVQLKPGADSGDRETWRVSKMKWGKKKDPATGKNADDRTT